MPIVATLMSERERALIASGELWHFSKATAAQLVVRKMTGGPDAPNAIIRLIAPTALQPDVWKFVRDLSVVDWQLFHGKDWAQYIYFFLGEPTGRRKSMNVQNAGLSIRIKGADFLRAADGQRVFFRPMNRIVVLRGDYDGPARLDPAP